MAHNPKSEFGKFLALEQRLANGDVPAHCVYTCNQLGLSGLLQTPAFWEAWSNLHPNPAAVDQKSWRDAIWQERQERIARVMGSQALDVSFFIAPAALDVVRSVNPEVAAEQLRHIANVGQHFGKGMHLVASNLVSDIYYGQWERSRWPAGLWMDTPPVGVQWYAPESEIAQTSAANIALVMDKGALSTHDTVAICRDAALVVGSDDWWDFRDWLDGRLDASAQTNPLPS